MVYAYQLLSIFVFLVLNMRIFHCLNYRKFIYIWIDVFCIIESYDLG